MTHHGCCPATITGNRAAREISSFSWYSSRSAEMNAANASVAAAEAGTNRLRIHMILNQIVRSSAMSALVAELAERQLRSSHGVR